MLSILARQNVSHFKLSKQLIEPAIKFNLLKPNFTKPQFAQLKFFKTSNRGMFGTRNQAGTNTRWPFSNLLESRIFRASTYAVGSTFVFFSLSTIWNYEKLLKLRNQYPFFQQPINKNSIFKWWDSLRENQKVYLLILGLNLLVFAAWRIPSLEPMMMRYFTLNLHSKHTLLPMFLSTFSHHSPLHLFFNMYCLYSFSSITTYQWGKETMLALYLSAGMFGSMASCILKVYQASAVPSLGASAAILGLISSTCILNPDLNISIMFLPIVFSAKQCLIGILCFDCCGLLLGWRFIDHAGHLGGTLFGAAYTLELHKYYKKFCRQVARTWNKIRN